MTIKDPLSLLLVDKIIYKSTICENFGEYEVDYVFFVTLDVNQSISFNKDEISNIKWIDV